MASPIDVMPSTPSGLTNTVPFMRMPLPCKSASWRPPLELLVLRKACELSLTQFPQYKINNN